MLFLIIAESPLNFKENFQMGSKIEGSIYRVWAMAPNDHISIRRDDGNHFQPLDAGQGLAGKLKQGDRVELVLGEGAVALHVRGNGEECGTEEFAWLETEVDVESLPATWTSTFGEELGHLIQIHGNVEIKKLV